VSVGAKIEHKAMKKKNMLLEMFNTCQTKKWFQHVFKKTKFEFQKKNVGGD